MNAAALLVLSLSCLKLTQEFYSLIRPRPKLSNFATYFRNIARFCPKLAKTSAINADFFTFKWFYNKHSSYIVGYSSHCMENC